MGYESGANIKETDSNQWLNPANRYQDRAILQLIEQ